MNTTASRKEVTHARIVDTAARAIRRSGYQGMGVADIMKSAGLTHGGFYAHFANRDALMVEAIERAGEDGMRSLLSAASRREARGAKPFQALVMAYLADGHIAAVESGCPIAALVAEIPRQADEVQAAARRRVLAFIDVIRERLPVCIPTDEAETIASTLVGALQMARALGDNSVGRAFLASHRRKLLARYLPESS
ncbi:MAG: TetR/AcrR family transcriptional regulator [Panacagrimonas sp.]